MKMATLFTMLRQNNAKTVYLIHEPFREFETRDFAFKLEAQGFRVKVAQDYRGNGEQAVSRAIKNSDFCVVLAFDEETVKKCEQEGVPVVDLMEEPSSK